MALGTGGNTDIDNSTGFTPGIVAYPDNAGTFYHSLSSQR